MRKSVWIVALSVVLAACSTQSRGTVTGPVYLEPAPSGNLFSVLSIPSPVWAGTTLASDGVAGTVVLTFGEPSTVVWTGPTGTFHGTVTGALPTLTVTGSDNGCLYSATGTVSNGTYSGNYDIGNGEGCVDKTGHGTFSVKQGAPTPCPEGQKDGQDGVGCVPIPPPPPVCTFIVSPLAFGTPQAGVSSAKAENQIVNVDASDASCKWTAVSNNDWLNGVKVVGINPPGPDGVGDGQASFDIKSNNAKGDDKRHGTLTVAGKTVDVYQKGKD